MKTIITPTATRAYTTGATIYYNFIYLFIHNSYNRKRKSINNENKQETS